MERLTEYESIGGHAHAIPTGDIDTALVRLSDYEDTGLTPAEVRSMHGEWEAMMSVLNSIGGYDRLRELAEADKDGRVIVSKYTVGQTVWYITGIHNRLIKSATILSYTCDVCSVGVDYDLIVKNCDGVVFENNEVVFFTEYEEAEKALEEAKRDV